MASRRRTDGDSERGAVLLSVLLVMIALIGMGMTALWMTSSNMQIGSTTSFRNQALYVAEQGIEAVRADLNRPTPPNGYSTAQWKSWLLTGDATLPGGATARNDAPTGSGTGADGKPNGIGVVYRNEATGLQDVVWPPAAWRGGGSTMGTYTVWIRNDTAELRRGLITADGNDTFVIRSQGVAIDGKTRVVLEVTMGPGSTPSNAPNPPLSEAPVLCNSGKNACDENSSVQAGVVVQ